MTTGFLVSLGVVQIHQKWSVIIRETPSEIKKVFDKPHYSIDTIVFDVMQTFKLHSIVRHTRFEKQEGYPVTEVLALLIMFPLMMLSLPDPLFDTLSSLVAKIDILQRDIEDLRDQVRNERETGV